MFRKAIAVVLAAGVAQALHEHNASNIPVKEGDGCVAPGTCEPPDAAFSNVIRGPAPGQQWNINGGFCGAFSVQQCALAFGAWISQDLVRKANREQKGIEHNMHGNVVEGYEVMPINVAFTAEHLKLSYDEWDYMQPSPQAPAFKAWMKSHLVKGEPIAWFPICKGDGHICYAGSCPNGGACDHVEPVFGIFSNHSLDDLTVYDDDVVLHASDQDYMPYYRPMSTLEDSLKMDGNCADAGSGFGKNEMYPCVDEDVTYGLSVTGLAVTGAADLPRVSLVVDTTYEPNVRSGETASKLHGNLTVSGLEAGEDYVLYRYLGTGTVPSGAPFDNGYEHATPFTPTADVWTFADPDFFYSDSAVYYIATKA